jgi:S1-C subfamily serine protease
MHSFERARTHRRLQLVAACALLALAPAFAPATLAAQDRPADARRWELRAAPAEGMLFTAVAGRARLGVRLDTEAEIADGARIVEVVEGGAAERAGLRSGDVITAIDGRPVVHATAPERRGNRPADRVSRLLAAYEPGDMVRVDYRRGGQRLSVHVELAEAELPALLQRALPFPEGMHTFPRGERVEGADSRPEALFRALMPFRSGLRLADLSAGLEPYFGASSGVLVLDVRDGYLGLAAGDVILRIGGRAVESAARAHTMLGTYGAGETVEIDVLRQRREVRLTQRLP